jgi:hypothetical protein
MCDPVGSEMLKSLELFVASIEAHENLEIVGENRMSDGSGETVLVIQDDRLAEKDLGYQITVDLNEIFSVIKTEKMADRFVAVIAREDVPIKLNGVTRIVGYYSRTHNWNKSKIGELRDRAKGQYACHVEVGFQKEHAEERMAVIDSH